MSGVLTAVLLVAVIGLVCAGLLVFASKVFHVAVDETVSAVRACLPGANCGGCGFAGCDDYAAKLFEDEELSCTLCSPGGPAVAEQIAEILGRSAGSTEPQVAQVMCNGTCDASRTLLEWQGMQSCKGAKGWFTSPNACMFGCVGLGDCHDACQEACQAQPYGLAAFREGEPRQHEHRERQRKRRYREPYARPCGRCPARQHLRGLL